MPKKPSKSAVVIDINKWVTNLVGGSVEDAKRYLQLLDPENAHGIETNLVILRTALEAEKEGAARKSLITAIRAAIRTNENALDAGGDGDAPTDDGLPRVYGADANAGDEGDPSTEEMAGVDQLVALIVGGTVAEAKRQLVHLSPPTGASAEKIMANLRILRAALEAEERGPNRSSLVSAMRTEILHIEESIADNAAEANEVDGSPMVHLRFASPSDFAPHPELMAIPTMKDVIGYTSSKRQADRTEELLTEQAALYDDIARHGVIEPLKVVPADPKSVANSGVTWWIVDGRHRHDAAKWAGESEIPFVEVNPEEVESIIVGSIVGRRHWTKTQKAFLAVERNPFLLGGKAGRSGKSPESGLFPTLGEIATRFGVSRSLLCEAVEFYRPFAGKQALESVRLQIMAGIGFANVVSGKGGEAATKDKAGKPLPVDVATTRLLKFGKTLSKAGADEWSEDHLSVFGETVREFWKSVPASLKPLFAAVAAEEGGAE